MGAHIPREAAELIRRYFALIDAQPLDQTPDRFGELAELFETDATIRPVNGTPLAWRDRFRPLRRGAREIVEWVRHDLTQVIDDGHGNVAFEHDGTYTLYDGTVLRMPGVTLATIRDGRFAEMRVYADWTSLSHALDEH